MSVFYDKILLNHHLLPLHPLKVVELYRFSYFDPILNE